MKVILLLAAVAVVTTQLKHGGLRQTAEHSVGDTRVKRHVVKESYNGTAIWNDGVFYVLNTTDDAFKRVFKMAMRTWTDNTCIDFVEDRNARHKVIMKNAAVCTSNIGRRGGDQYLCLSSTRVGVAVHEIGHVLGLLHTMQRFDRDQFVTVVPHNIIPAFLEDFRPVQQDKADVYGLSYDYGSVMHYDERSFSVNGMPTIYAKDPHYQKTMGSDIISFYDIFVANKRYGCDAKCNKSTSAKCLNEGFPHPRNCSICICPSGYGGALCDRRPPGCGQDLRATLRKKTLKHRIGYGLGIRDEFVFCNFLITGPQGSKIEVELLSVSLGYDNSGCYLGGVEIKAQQDQKMTGYRFCAVNGTGGPIVSSSNPLPIILFNRFTYMDIVLTYRYI